MICTECLDTMPESPTIRYLLENSKRLSVGDMHWRIDKGFIEAAIEEGCDPCLCHFCEKPIRPRHVITISRTDRETGSPENPVVAAVVHAGCASQPCMNKEDWGKKHAKS